MAGNPAREETGAPETEFTYRRIGHKGAAALEMGNTVDSFEAAVEVGVDMIELDVLRAKEGRLIVAHDPDDARRRRPLALTEALDAFRDRPLDEVELDCDLKLAGREAELAGALEGRGLLDRAMVSTMELESIRKLRRIEPDLRLGWTYPKIKRDWTQYGWASPAIIAGLTALRRRFPAILARRAPELEIDAVWAYHPIITPKLVDTARDIGVELFAWTVDDLARMRELIAMGVDGICSNDPRLFEVAEGEPLPTQDEVEGEPKEPRIRRLFGIGRAKRSEPEPETEEKAPRPE
jgi:glycerophosphoryl diester phosphodiesterase